MRKFLAVIVLILLIIGGQMVMATPSPLANATLAATQSVTATPTAAVPNTGLIKGGLSGEAQTLTGAGSTFAQPLYTKWFSDYAALTGVKISYQGIGSSGGIKGIQSQSLDFGATDGFMTDDQLKAAKGGNILHVATALGGVSVVYNIPELSDPIKLTADTLSLIYLGPSAANYNGPDGKPLTPLLMWNDPRLVADNPGLKDIARNIWVIHRSDGSGTTNIFTNYLSAVNANWQKDIGAGNTVAWPIGVAGKGSDGVTSNLRQAPYTIGYVEQAYADQNGLQVALLKNSAGNWVKSSADTVAAAAAGVQLPTDLRAIIVNANGPNAYPIAGFTWILVYQNQVDVATATALARMLWWGIHDGQTETAALGYAPLPLSAIQKDEAQLVKIVVGGKPALPADLLSAIAP